jgi:hypothetical protein
MRSILFSVCTYPLSNAKPQTLLSPEAYPSHLDVAYFCSSQSQHLRITVIELVYIPRFGS